MQQGINNVQPSNIHARGRHSLQMHPTLGDRVHKVSSHPVDGSRKSLGHPGKLHHRRSSKEVMLSPFKSVVRRIHRTSWNNFKDNSTDFEINRPIHFPLHNASTAPEPQLHEPQLREPDLLPINRISQNGKNDLEAQDLSDTLSFKYPPPPPDFPDRSITRRTDMNNQRDTAGNSNYNNNNNNNDRESTGSNSQGVHNGQTHEHSNEGGRPKRPNQKSNFPVLVVQSLSKYTFVEDMNGAELALRSLRNLSLDRSVHELLTKVGAIRATISAMERFFTRSPTILLLGLLFIADVSRGSRPNQRHIGQNGGLQLINRILLDGDVRDIYLLERACITLRTVCAGSDYNAVLSGVCGSVEAVLKTMRRWKRCGELQERSLDILTTVIRDASENADVALDSGAVSEVLSTIRQYPDHVNVQVAAARTACELARASETAREDMGGAGIIDDLHHAVVAFPTHGEFTIVAARCVRYLAFSTVNRTRIARTALAAVLVGRVAAGPFRDDRRVVAAVLQALANITYDEQAGKTGVVQGTGTATLLSIMDAYQADHIIAEAVCRVLRNASDGIPSTKRLVARHSCIPRVAKTLRAHPNHPGIQEHACATLINLWPTHETAVRATALDQHLVAVARTHAANEHVMRQIDGLRARLDKTNPSCGRGALHCLS